MNSYLRRNRRSTKDPDRLIQDAQAAERQRPPDPAAFARETATLRAYGARQATALGLATEADSDQRVQDARAARRPGGAGRRKAAIRSSGGQDQAP